ncbi:MAG TPA: NADH-quinone oxidoreductase subunit D [Coriobacteriia bacterium]
MSDIERTPRRIAAEGSQTSPVLPAGLKRMPHGVDELATEHLVLNMGPQHPSTHGVLHVLVELDGEEVIAAEASLGYLHRGIEKLAESRRYHQVATLLDRADYVSGIFTETAFALAVERLADIEVPAKATWLRTLAMEINRYASHLVWLGTFGMDAGAMAPFLYIMRDREMLVDVLEALTGSRMMFNYVRPGGVFADIPAGITDKIHAWLRVADSYLDDNDALLGGNEIFQMRMKGTGVIDASTALAFGMTGGCLRGSGVDYDLRRDIPYCSYPQLDFDVPLAQSGDNWARYVVRVGEMRQCLRLIRQLVDGIPEGEFTAKISKVFRPPVGESYAAVESPRGELGIHIVSDGGLTPYRMRLRSPAYFNLAIVDEALAGGLIADAIVTLGSLDIVLGEIDR